MGKLSRRGAEVKIIYNESLDPIFVFYSQKSPLGGKHGWNKWVPPTKEELIERIRNYRKIWKPFERPFFSMMEKLTGTPSQNKLIDVHVVSGNPRQIGFPIIIKSGFSNEDFILTLVHELIHYYINIHNLPESFKNSENGGETRLTRKHILVFSIMKYFFENVIKKPKFITSAISNSKKHETDEYIKAWRDAEKNYLEVIKTFKKHSLKKIPKH